VGAALVNELETPLLAFMLDNKNPYAGFIGLQLWTVRNPLARVVGFAPDKLKSLAIVVR